MDLKQRPLSPHLQIYKPQLNSMMSILHRLAGVYLSLGIMALALWIIALGSSSTCFLEMSSLYKTPLGQLIFASWVFAFFYHFSNGIRHLIWDVGFGYGMKSVYRSGWFVFLFTTVISLLVLSRFYI